MKVYVRKLLSHDITHEVSVTTSIVNEFFDGQTSFKMIGKKSNESGIVTINSATDPRFGGDFKKILREESNVSEGDIVLIYKHQNHYVVDVVTKQDSKFNSIMELCKEDKRHTLLFGEQSESVIDMSGVDNENKAKFKEWLISKKYSDSSSTQYTNHVNLASKEALNKDIIDTSLYNITDINSLEKSIELIKQMEEYVVRKKNGNGINEAALNLYLNFAYDLFNLEQENCMSILDKYEAFYINNIEEIKNIQELVDGVELRKQFVEEYPLDRIKNLTLEEYALGTGNNESLSYKIEFGKYKHTGLGIGGGSSGKHGIYFGKDDKQYHGYQTKILENPTEYWENFRSQLYNFLKEIGETNQFPNLRQKYPLLENVPLVLAKLCFLYYPNKFINIGSRGRLQTIIDLFEINVSDEKISSLMSFEISKYLRERISVINNDDPQWIGHTLWRFIRTIEDSEESDELEIFEENNIFDDYDKEKFLGEVFIDESKYDSMVSILEKKKNIILEGAPGVGKTFMAKRLAYSIIGKKDSNKVKLIQFHQSYSYEDFVEGYRPTDNGFKLEKGIFYKLCKKAEANPTENYYLIIDEINRGNLSKIFGELLMLVEADKRGESLTLAYSEENFSVPSNLYVIGLMNTADRSLALIDYALRRRFSFISIEPAFESEKFIKIFNEQFENNFNSVIEIIKKINEAIEQDKSLGAGFKIGHSYFCPNLKDRKGTKKDIEDIIVYEILPLLEEYWYDDPDSIVQWKNSLYGVLND